MSEMIGPTPTSQEAPVPRESKVAHDARVDAWLERATHREQVYAGIEGLRVAYQNKLTTIDSRFDVTITPGQAMISSSPAKSYNANIACEGLLFLQVPFTATEKNGVLTKPSVTPDQLVGHVLTALDTGG